MGGSSGYPDVIRLRHVLTGVLVTLMKGLGGPEEL
jgi:hypothetical protein